MTEREEESRIANFTKNINRYLESIGKELNIQVALTIYAARQSFAIE
jgi:hypothetical protein